MQREHEGIADKTLIYIPPILVFFAGIINILSSLFSIPESRLAILEEVLPMMIIHASRTLTLVLGVFLIVLAKGLTEKKVIAWRLSVVLLGASLLFNITKGIDVEEAIFILFTLYTLILSRQVYTVASDLFRTFSAIRSSLIAFGLLFLYSLIGYFLFRHQFKGPVYFPNIAFDYFHTVFGLGRDALIPAGRQAFWFQTSIITISVGIFTFLFSSLFAPYVRFLSKVGALDLSGVRNLVLRYGQNSICYFALLGHKKFFTAENTAGVLVYGIKAGVALSLGEPITSDEGSMTRILESFRTDMHKRGLKVASYQITEEALSSYEQLGMKTVKIGEEAIIQTSDFKIDTPKYSEIRHCVSRLTRLRARFEWHSMDAIPTHLLGQVAAIHEQWLGEKKGGELGFSMDFFPLPKEHHGYLLAVLSETGELWAVLSFFPYKGGGGMALDMMVRSQTAPNSTMEAAIAESIHFFTKKSITEVSLGMAPLADTEREKNKNLLEKGIRLVYNNVTTLYGYRSLFNFKNKFSPTWKKKYLAFSSFTDLPTVALALLRLHIESNHE